MSTSPWMAPCCRPERPMPLWSGPPEKRIHRHHHQALARVLALQSQAGNERKGISAASCSATRPTAPPSIRMRCCAGNPRPIQHCPATENICAGLGELWETFPRPLSVFPLIGILAPALTDALAVQSFHSDAGAHYKPQHEQPVPHQPTPIASGVPIALSSNAA